MDPLPGAKYVVPNSRIPKVLGILNIVFAAGLLLCGLCSAAYVMMLPALGKAMTQMQQKVQAQQDAEKKAILDALADEEKAAKTEQEKKAIQEKRRDVESRPKVALAMGMDINQMGFDDPRLVAFGWVDLATGLILNVLLLASGIGLIRRRPWGLKLGSGVAAAKLVRLVLLYGYFALVLVPVFSQKMAKVAGEMMVQQQQAMGNPMPPISTEMLTRTYMIMYTASSVGMIVFGSIYPAILLWLLNRRDAKAACTGPEQRLEPEETW